MGGAGEIDDVAGRGRKEYLEERDGEKEVKLEEKEKQSGVGRGNYKRRKESFEERDDERDVKQEG